MEKSQPKKNISYHECIYEVFLKSKNPEKL